MDKSGFSTVWKKFNRHTKVFQRMETFFADFPMNGKKFSTVWKNVPDAIYLGCSGLIRENKKGLFV